ncbi:MAG: metallophosphoesterase [Dehalococcoidia bacterium]|nr:metallophosphoesterase [Dehalococcoidia bacterium]
MDIRAPLRVLHCSDFHLDSHFRENGLKVLRSLVALERSLGVDTILVAGDVFDSTRQTAGFVDDVTDCFHSFEAPLVAIPGNHDVVYDHRDPTSLLFSRMKDRSSYLATAEGQTIVAADGRLRVWGRGMPEHSPTNDPLANLEDMASDSLWNVVLAHGELDHHRGGVSYSSPINLHDHGSELGNVDYVALGHCHYPRQTEHGRTIMRYSGAATTIGGAGTVTLVEFSSEHGLMITSYSIEK